MTRTNRITTLIVSLLTAGISLAGNTTFAASPVDVEIPLNIPGAHTVDAEQLIDLANTIPTLILVDSRITSDRKHGHIEGSVSLPDIDTNCASLAALTPQKRHPLLFYCNGVKCGRSVVATTIAQDCGYETIYWFRGGFEEWRDKDYPYIKE